ncbi:GDSL esterase/lipase At4g26790-like [Cornus florida]|uniref:GDSL esterase/lipase At4g26790-like n=1 Tax=Cornus florida TaxID=4283 RepID=UPI00289AEEDC|nr:GDSL esterase/lipase At4g26790-like [Cornus florida]
MVYKYIIPWLILVLTATSAATVAGNVPAIIVFGDSSVDAGNNNQILTIARANFPPYGRDFPGGTATGRFSNGKIPPDFISEAFGLNPIVPAYLDPMYNISDFAVGVSFASAGTGYDTATSNVLKTIPLWKEMEYYKEYQKRLRDYLGDDKANYIISEALYLISMGTNDFLENYYLLPITQARYSVDQYQDVLIGMAENFLRELHELGARKISLGGIPPMGCLPLQRSTNLMTGKGDTCVEEYNVVSVSFNAKLNGLVQKLNKELPGAQLVYSNVYDLFWEYIHNPSPYGFEDGGRACCATGMYEMSYLCNKMNPLTCKDASKFLFWDAFHPSEQTSRIISEHVVKNELHQFRAEDGTGAGGSSHLGGGSSDLGGASAPRGFSPSLILYIYFPIIYIYIFGNM